LAALLASVIVNVVPTKIPLVPGGVAGAFVAIAGVALLIAGTTSGNWPLIAVATILVGAGAGVTAAAAYGIAGLVGRGQRAPVFAKMYLAAFSGYSLPVLGIGLLAVRIGFTEAFVIMTILLGIITAALPFLTSRNPAFASNTTWSPSSTS
jgi:hypothetical protein